MNMILITHVSVCLFILTLHILPSASRKNRKLYDLEEDSIRRRELDNYLRDAEEEIERQVARERVEVPDYISLKRENYNYEDDEEERNDDNGQDGKEMYSRYVEDEEQKNDKCSVKEKYRYTNADVRHLFETLDRMLNFWEKNFKSVIVDGLFGLRMTEATTLYNLKHMKKSQRFYEDVKHLHARVEGVSVKTYSVVSKRNQTYAQSFLKVLDKPFSFQRSWRNYRPDLLEKIDNKKEDFDEAKSDRCMKELMGIFKKLGTCYVSDNCFKMFTEPGKKEYFLTHQTLYFLLGETNGCHNNLKKKIGSNTKLQNLYDKYGKNIYKQMISKDFGDIKNWDIIAEQGAICSILGIVECLRMDVMRKMLHWVNKQGCITDQPLNKNEKRVDAYIGKCSQHTTTVVMAYLASHISLIVDQPSCKLIS